MGHDLGSHGLTKGHSPALESGAFSLIAHRSPVSGVDAHGSLIATAGYDGRVILWEATQHRSIAVGWHDHLVNDCRFSSSGSMLATASSDYSARIWSIPDLRLKTVLTGH